MDSGASVAAVVGCLLLAGLGVVQVALVLGAPWGRFVWGGQHDGVLPVRLRVGSAVALVLYGVFALVLLDAGGWIDVAAEGASGVAAWILFGYLALGTLQNAISRSRPERLAMTPVTAALAVCAFLVASG